MDRSNGTALLIIDGHVHTYPDHAAARVIESFTAFHRMEPTPSVGRGTVEDLLSRMEEGGIRYAVTANFAPAKSAQKTNAWSLAAAREHPALLPLVCISPETSLEELCQYVDQGARGVKMHTGIQAFEPADSALDPLYRFCEDRALPVTFHCGETSRVHMNEYSSMEHILPAVEKYPGIPFILTHLAAGNPDTVLDIARRCPNALFDTSITFSGEHCIHRIHDNAWEDDRKAAELFREIGCSRVTFGSDYPFGNPVRDVRRILSLPLTDEEKRLILGENTARIYRLNSEFRIKNSE